MLRNAYVSVMDDDLNAFSQLPKTTRFQLMIMLSWVCSAVFAVSAGTYYVFGTSVIAHTAILIAIFFTADLFRRARDGKVHHRDAMRNKHDGTALYDDLCGA